MLPSWIHVRWHARTVGRHASSHPLQMQCIASGEQDRLVENLHVMGLQLRLLLYSTVQYILSVMIAIVQGHIH